MTKGARERYVASTAQVGDDGPCPQDRSLPEQERTVSAQPFPRFRAVPQTSASVVQLNFSVVQCCNSRPAVPQNLKISKNQKLEIQYFIFPLGVQNNCVFSEGGMGRQVWKTMQRGEVKSCVEVSRFRIFRIFGFSRLL